MAKRLIVAVGGAEEAARQSCEGGGIVVKIAGLVRKIAAEYL